MHPPRVITALKQSPFRSGSFLKAVMSPRSRASSDVTRWASESRMDFSTSAPGVGGRVTNAPPPKLTAAEASWKATADASAAGGVRSRRGGKSLEAPGSCVSRRQT